MTLERPLRIAITVDPEIAVPPKLYGGIERIVDMLVQGLVARGHDVTLFAHADSTVPCKLEPYPGFKSRAKSDLLRNMWRVSSKTILEKYDIVHSFARLAYLLPLLPLRIPKIMSYQRAITPRSVMWGNRLARGTLHFSGCSHQMTKPFTSNGNWHVVYNGAPLQKYEFKNRLAEDAPLIYLGRVEELKGAHLAIEVAQKSGRKLIIAGNIPEGDSQQKYFQERIAPHLDGQRIQYVGPVDDVQKNELLGSAAAFLMPILLEEAFGIVMAEALACGTPVIALNRGSVPEVVQHGVNGFVCTSVEEMVESVNRINEIDRYNCRLDMEKRFSDAVMVNGYEELYSKLLQHESAR